MTSRILSPRHNLPPAPSRLPFAIKRRDPPPISPEDICSLTSRVSFYPPPEEHYMSPMGRSLFAPTPQNALHIQYAVNVCEDEDRPTTTENILFTMPMEEEEEGSSSSESDDSRDGYRPHFIPMTEEESPAEISFASLNNAPEPYVDMSSSLFAHPGYYATFPNIITCWDPLPLADDWKHGSGQSYLSHIKQQAEEARKREAEMMLQRYRMAVADALLNRLRRLPPPPSRIIFGLEKERPYVKSGLSREVSCRC